MKCETCEGRGFIEYEHGLIQVRCSDCKGTGEIPDVLTEEVLQRAIDMPSPEPLGKEDMEALAKDTYIPPEAVESIELPKELEEALNDDPKYLIIPVTIPSKTIDETADIAREIIKASKEADDSDSGTGPDNQPTGSETPLQHKKSRKPKARKKTAKRPG